MKRILSFMLVIVVITVISVPAFAAQYETSDLNDAGYPDIYEVWTDRVTYPYAVVGDFEYDMSTLNQPNIRKTALYFSDVPMRRNYGKFDFNVTEGENLVFTYVLTDGEWVYEATHTTALNTDPDIIYYIWSNHDVLKVSDNSVYIEAGTYNEPMCDGSSCPATDRNFDYVCDDCGLTLAYNLRVTPDTYSIVVEHEDGTTIKSSFTETIEGTVVNAVYNDSRITLSFDNAVNHYQYKLVDGVWTDYASYPNIYSHAISLPATASILSSDLTIYDIDGDVFFQNPLWLMMEQVTQGEMKNLTAETVGTMKVLVLCGVGLMALLVVLSLFGKRSLISHKR